MRKPKKPTHKPKRKIAASRSRDPEAAHRDEIIREFDRAEPIPPTKEIQLMSKEEREILVRPSTN
jgi:hypothetical protein